MVSAGSLKDGTFADYRGAVVSARLLAFRCWGWGTDGEEPPAPTCSIRRLVRSCSALLHVAAASGDFSIASDAASALMMRAFSAKGELVKLPLALSMELSSGAASLVAAVDDFVNPGNGPRSRLGAAAGEAPHAAAGEPEDDRQPLEQAESKVTASGSASLVAMAAVIFSSLREATFKTVATRSHNGDAADNPAPELGAKQADAFLGAGAAFAPDGTAHSSDAIARGMLAVRRFLASAPVSVADDGDGGATALQGGVEACASAKADADRIAMEAIPFASVLHHHSGCLPKADGARAAGSAAKTVGLLSLVGKACTQLTAGKCVSKALASLVSAIPDHIAALPFSKVNEALQAAAQIFSVAGFRGLLPVGGSLESKFAGVPQAQLDEAIRVTAAGLDLGADHLADRTEPNASQISSKDFRATAINAWGALIMRDDVIGRSGTSIADFAVSNLLYCTHSILKLVNSPTQALPPKVRDGIVSLATISVEILHRALLSSPSSVAKDVISNSEQLEFTIFTCLSLPDAALLNVAALLLLHRAVFASFHDWTVSPREPAVRRGVLIRSARILHRLAALRRAPEILSTSRSLAERFPDGIPPAESQRMLHERSSLVTRLIAAAFGQYGPPLDEMVIGARSGALCATTNADDYSLPKPDEHDIHFDAPLHRGVRSGIDAGMRPLLNRPQPSAFLSHGFCRGRVVGFVVGHGEPHLAVMPDCSNVAVATNSLIENLAVASLERERQRAHRAEVEAAEAGRGTPPAPLAVFRPKFSVLRPAASDDPSFSPFRPMGVCLMSFEEASMRGLTDGWSRDVMAMADAGVRQALPGAAGAARVFTAAERQAAAADAAAPAFLAVRARVFGTQAECGGRPQPLCPLAEPVGFEPIGMLENSVPRLVLWQPIAPEGFVAVGVAVSEAGSTEGPSKKSCWCVHASLTQVAGEAFTSLPRLQVVSCPPGSLTSEALAAAGAPRAVASAAAAAEGGLALSATLALGADQASVGKLCCSSSAAVVTPGRPTIARLRADSPGDIAKAGPAENAATRMSAVNLCLVNCLASALHDEPGVPQDMRRAALLAAGSILSVGLPALSAPQVAMLFGTSKLKVSCDSFGTSMLACFMRPHTRPDGLLTSGVSVLESHPHATILHQRLAAEVGFAMWHDASALPSGADADRLARVCISLATRHSASDNRTVVCAVLTLGQLARDVSTLDPKLRNASKMLLWELLFRRTSLESELRVAPEALVNGLAEAGKEQMPKSMREPPTGQCCATM